MPTLTRAVARLLLVAFTLASATVVTTAPSDALTIGQLAVQEASRHQGQPYVYGAAGPTRFDCSGLTLYVWGRFGKRLPHNAAQQYSSSAVRHVAASGRALGDLIFMRNSYGQITHVGIYAGSNRWWVAPHTGAYVKLQTLYSSNYVVARLR